MKDVLEYTNNLKNIQGCLYVLEAVYSKDLDKTKVDPFVSIMFSLYERHDIVNQDIVRILDKYRVDLSHYFTEEQMQVIMSDYKEIIELCYFFKIRSMYSQHIPIDFLNLFESNAKLSGQSKVYLPYADEASILIDHPECNYDGFEKDQELWALMQILIQSKNINANIIGGVGEESYNKYDYIYTMPPFVNGKNLAKVVNSIKYWIEYNIADNGELWCILPMGFCYDLGMWGKFREYVVKEALDYRVQVISLPERLFANTSIPVCILRMIKDNHHKLELFDVSENSFCNKYDANRSRGLNVDEVNYVLEYNETDYFWSTSDFNELEGWFNMQPSRYILREFQRYESSRANSLKVRLGDVISISSLSKITKRDIPIPVVGMRELSFDANLCEIDYNDIPLINYSGYRVLKEDSLVVGFIGGKFKVGYIHGLDKEHYCALRSEVYPIKIQRNDLLEDYLFHELLSDNLRYQANQLAFGSVITRLHKSDFESLYINLPSLEEQAEVVNNSNKLQLIVANKKLEDSFNSFRRDVHMKKHTIGHSIFALGNWLDILDLARERGNGIVDDKAVVGKSHHPITIPEIYDNIRKSFTALQEQINRFDIGYGMKKQWFNLNDYIEQYIVQHQYPQFRYDYIKSNDLQYSSDVEFPVEALNIVLGNIISNACSYGFNQNHEIKENIIKIDVDIVGDYYKLSVSNNGAPINDQIKIDTIFEWGISSNRGETHNGIGGYEIKRLMSEFGGEVEIISNPNDEFTVTYELYFYNTNIK